MNSTSCKKILIVEDNIFLSLFFHRLVDRMGYEVVGLASNGVDAIDLFAHHQPDLILMDICLEGELDGISTASKFREMGNVPVIFLTGNSRFFDNEYFESIDSYTDYLIKPVTGYELQHSINRAIDQTESVLQAEL